MVVTLFLVLRLVFSLSLNESEHHTLRGANHVIVFL